MLTRLDFEAIRPRLEAVRKPTRPRIHDLYDVFCDLVYVIDNDVPWRVKNTRVPWRTTHEYSLQWKDLLPGLLVELGLAGAAEKLARRVNVPGNSVRCFLRSGSDALEDAQPFDSKKEAIEQYQRDAYELARYGQTHVASIHIADTVGELTEYPDFVLSLGPRGGIRIEKA